MIFIVNYISKVLLFLAQTKDKYLFNQSKKFILSWGEGTYGMPRITSYDGKSKISIGSYCSIAGGVSFLLGANHQRGLITTYPRILINNKSKTPSNELGDILIGSDVWIGYNATIIGPVHIGDGAIIAAGSVVVSDVPPYSVVAGVPAVVKKYRFAEDEIEELLKIKWWMWDKNLIQEREYDIYSSDSQAFINKYSS